MTKMIKLIVLAGLLYSCEYNDINNRAELTPGTYKGHFIRSNPYAKYAPSDVTLTFTVDRFTGESSITKYPAICRGRYKVTGQEIEFVNDCAWTAEFDWSLILSGKFELKVDGGQVEMTRSSNGLSDYYKLKLK